MKRILPVGFIVVLWLVFFWRQIGGGEVWYCCDNLLVNVPSKVFLAEELKAGRFPLWNPYIFAGTPFFADINLAVLHPLNLLYLVLPPFRALTMGVLMLFLGGSVGMYVLGRTIRLGRFTSLVGAAVFGFSGSLIVYTNNIPILQVAALVPWAMAAWIGYLKTMTGRDLVIFVLVAVFQFFSGHPQFTYYTWLMLIAYTLTIKPSFQMVRLGLNAALLVALVSSIQAIPFLEFAFSSTRAGRDFAFATIDSVHPLSLIRLILPGIVGDLSGGTAWIQAGTVHGYVGFLPLLLAPLAWKAKIGRFFIAIAVISILMAMGKYTPVYWLAYHVVPGIAWFREPVQILFLWGFGLAGAAMVAVERLVKKPSGSRYMLIVGFVFLLAAGVVSVGQMSIWGEISRLSFLPDRLLDKIMNISEYQRMLLGQHFVYNLALSGGIGVIGVIAAVRLRLRLAKIFLLGVLFADLYVYGQTNVMTVAEGTVTGWYESTKTRIASWKLPDSTNYRYYTDPAIYQYPSKRPLGQFNDPGESAWQFTILRPTLGMLYGLSAVDGYASMVRGSYQQWLGGDGRDPTGVVISSVTDPALAMAGVRYIITKSNNTLLADTKRYRMLAAERTIAVYEDKKAEVARDVIPRPRSSGIIVGLALTLIGLGWCAFTFVKETGR